MYGGMDQSSVDIERNRSLLVQRSDNGKCVYGS